MMNEQFETKKQFIQKTLSDINIGGNAKGQHLFKGGFISIEGTSELPRVGVGSKTMLFNKSQSQFNIN
jgi:hypothetical protein